MNKQRALLLDRDGVINHDTGYVSTCERFEFMPGIFPFLRAARDRGYRLAILTNQAGVARGIFTPKDYDQVTAAMLLALRREAIDIELVLACFEHPEGVVAAYGRESYWRKPNPGMVLDAIRRLNINPTRSAFLGDNLRDMQAAQAGGIQQCLWLTHEDPTVPKGIKTVKDFAEALIDLSA